MRLELGSLARPRGHVSRAVVPADVAPLGALLLAAYRGGPDDEDETLEDAVRLVEQTFEGTSGPLIEAASRCIETEGTIRCACLVTRWRGTPLVAHVVTEPAFQRRGFATQLLREAAWELQGAGESLFRLYVTQANVSAIRAYERVGFAVVR
jgi:GNAT superfamily N-acetyltransferase